MGKYDAQPQSVVESILLKPEYAKKNDEYGSTSTDVENLSGSLDDCDTSNADEKGTYWTASAGLTATIMGTVVLSLPSSMRDCGWLLGSCVLVFVALMSDFSLVIIARCGHGAQMFMLDELMGRYYGIKGARSVAAALIILLFLACVTILIAASDQWYSILTENNNHDLSWYSVTAITAGVMFPFTTLRTLTDVTGLSTAALLAISVTIAMMVVKLISSGVAPSVKAVTSNSEDVFTGLSIQMLAYCCQFNILDMLKEMKPDSKLDVVPAIHTAVGISTAFYITAALSGYLLLGAATSGDVLSSGITMDVGSFNSIAIAQSFMSLTNMLKFPLILTPLRNTINEQFHDLFHSTEKASNRSLRPMITEDGEELFLDESNGAYRLVDGKHKRVGTWNEKKRSIEKAVLSYPAHILQTFLLNAAILGIACLVRNLAKGFGIIACTAGVYICFILPGLLYMGGVTKGDVECPAGWKPLYWGAGLAMVLFGIFVGVSSLVVLILTW